MSEKEDRSVTISAEDWETLRAALLGSTVAQTDEEFTDALIAERRALRLMERYDEAQGK